MRVDRPEAVGNIETALVAAWNAFHRVYDAMGKLPGGHPIEWYKTAPLATLLVLRNARHHNHAHGIRTIHSYHADEEKDVKKRRKYVFVEFPAAEEGATNFNVFISWNDLNSLFSLPFAETRVRDENKQLITDYIGADRFPIYASAFHLKEHRVFFDAVPLLINAAGVICPLLKGKVDTKSTESHFFMWHFSTVPQSNMANPQVDCGLFNLPK